MSNFIAVIFFFLVQFSCASQVSESKIMVNVPTIEQEASSIWRTINDIDFLEKQGYQIKLPQHDLIASLIEKSKNNNFGNADFEVIYNLLESNVYNVSDYEKAEKSVTAQIELLYSFVDQLKSDKGSWNWDFKIFETYNIVFTLYGTGGSYDPDQGTVTLFTNSNGEFMKYDKPANTIIHEIVHMGIEASIIQQYDLPHALKERIVDHITIFLFKDYLPNYKVQTMGDTKIDSYLKNKSDLKDLHLVVEKYLQEK